MAEGGERQGGTARCRTPADGARGARAHSAADEGRGSGATCRQRQTHRQRAREGRRERADAGPIIRSETSYNRIGLTSTNRLAAPNLQRITNSVKPQICISIYFVLI